LKDNENYKLLNTDIAQQTMKVVDRNFKSFFALISKAKQGDCKFSNIKLPHYLPKDGYFMLIIPRFTVKDGYFTVPMSNAFKKEFGIVKLPFPKNLTRNKSKRFVLYQSITANSLKLTLSTYKNNKPCNSTLIMRLV